MNATSQAPESRWTDARRIAALREWHPRWAAFARPASELMLRALGPAKGKHVLDLASGAGEPALNLAAAVGPTGHVVASDLGAELLAIAEKEARARGLTNLEFRVADAQFLPFPGESFDAITCRFGLMFLPDCLQALRECRRVLKPGGRAIFLVWAEYEQPFWLSTIGVLKKYACLPDVPPDAPHIFRFAEPGKLRRAMERAEYQSVKEERLTIELTWLGAPRELWTYFSETSSMYRPFLESLTEESRESAARDAEAALREYSDGRQLRLPAKVVLVTGKRT